MEFHHSASGLAAVAIAVFALQLTMPAPAVAATDPAESPARATTLAVEFCPIGGCRPAPAPWSSAAFGATVLAMAWTARRRDSDR
jgi:MYXO-CTERM domain-containing protein